jgi:hypothetical protein
MVSLSKHTRTRPEDATVKSPRARMDILAAFRELGSYRSAADLCGTTHKTVRRILERQQQGPPPPRGARRHNTAVAIDVVREKVAATDGRISAKRLLPLARADLAGRGPEGFPFPDSGGIGRMTRAVGRNTPGGTLVGSAYLLRLRPLASLSVVPSLPKWSQRVEYLSSPNTEARRDA